MFKQTKIILAGLCLSFIITSINAAHPVWEKNPEWELVEATEKNLKRWAELEKVILEGKGKERKIAMNEMIELNLGSKKIIEKQNGTRNRRLRKAFKTVIRNRIYWSPLDNDFLPFSPVIGITKKGKRFYLVKAEIDGELLIGKMCRETDAGHFPSKGKEVLSKNFKIMQSRGIWTSWNKDLELMKSMGMNKEGKRVYAARAWIDDGIHIGTYIAGSDKALIPFDGKVREVKEFEVMVNYLGKAVGGELERKLYVLRKKFPNDFQVIRDTYRSILKSEPIRVEPLLPLHPKTQKLIDPNPDSKKQIRQ